MIVKTDCETDGALHSTNHGECTAPALGKARLWLRPDLGLLGHGHPVDLRVLVPPAEGVEHVEEGHRHVDEDYQRKQRVCNVKLLWIVIF